MRFMEVLIFAKILLGAKEWFPYFEDIKPR